LRTFESETNKVLISNNDRYNTGHLTGRWQTKKKRERKGRKRVREESFQIFHF